MGSTSHIRFYQARNTNKITPDKDAARHRRADHERIRIPDQHKPSICDGIADFHHALIAGGAYSTKVYGLSRPSTGQMSHEIHAFVKNPDNIDTISNQAVKQHMRTRRIVIVPGAHV